MTLQPLTVGARRYSIHSLAALPPRLPYCVRVLAENVLRHVGRNAVNAADVDRIVDAVERLARPAT